jgi:pimeloyl-[acyl-carrier protein] synthase
MTLDMCASPSVSATFNGRPPSVYDLQRPEVIADPWPLYRRLLADSQPLWDRGVRSWLVSRHADVSRLLDDRRLSAVTDHRRAAGYAPEQLRHIFPLLSAHVSFVDAPDHTRLRRVLADPFKPRLVEAMHEWITQAVAEALEPCLSRGRMDVITDLGTRVPLLVIRRMLGLEDVELAALHRWSSAWGQVVAAPGHLPTGPVEQVRSDVNQLIDRLRRLVSDHRRAPRETVTDALVRAADAGRLSDVELIGNLMMLVTAGQETTANLIGNSVAALLDDPALADRLREEPALLPAAVDEFARVYPPTQYTVRVARSPLTIGGREVSTGQSVVLMLAAANRDPAAFAQPDLIRLDRPPVPRPVAFGYGPHFCFGAPLARLETRVVLSGLLAHAGWLRQDGERRWRANGNLRGLAHLPVSLRAALPGSVTEPDRAPPDDVGGCSPPPHTGSGCAPPDHRPTTPTRREAP